MLLPAASVPPFSTFTSPTVPVPLNVPPEATVTFDMIAPFTANVPALTAVVPV